MCVKPAANNLMSAGTPMSRLRSTPESLPLALNVFMPITMKGWHSALRRHASAYRRRQNLYAKNLTGLQRVLDIQRLVHNWVRPHWGLAKDTTPAMAMGYCNRRLSIEELLTKRGFSSLIP
jgi:hypothetical protein